MATSEHETHDPRSTKRLMRRAVRELVAPEPVPAWFYVLPSSRRRGAAVTALQEWPTKEVRKAAVKALRSSDPRRRRVGVLVLGELRFPDPAGRRPAFPGKSIRALLALAQTETDVDVVIELARALGYRRDPRALPTLLRWVGHEHASVRFFVACSLPMAVSDETEQQVVDALITLAGDGDSRVRDYALFGLSELDLDTPQIRDAALHAASDPDGWVAGQALLNLTALGDPRALGPLAAFLRTGKRRPVALYGFEAAGRVADPALLTALHARKPKKPYRAAFAEAVEACETSTPIPLD